MFARLMTYQLHTAMKQGFTNEKEEKIEHSTESKYNAAQKQSCVESLKDVYQKRKQDYFLKMYEYQPKDILEKGIRSFKDSFEDTVVLELYFEEII